MQVRVVVDTNILIGAAYNEGSDSARVVDRCRDGRLVAVVSRAIVSEYYYIVPRAVRKGDPCAWLDEFLRHAEMVIPAETPGILSFDPSDDMLFHAAKAGEAAFVVTNDRPVLQVRTYEGIRTVRPGQLLGLIEESGQERSGPVRGSE